LKAFWKTGVVLVIAIGLGLYAFLVESKKPAEPEKPKEKALALEKSKVLSVTLEPKEGETVRVAKEGEAWKLTAPFEAPADSGEVDSLLSNLESLEIQDVAAPSPSPSSLGDFGLASPKNTVSLMVQGKNEPEKLLIGEKTPDGGAVYAKTPDKPRVFTIPSYLETSLTKKPFDLRDRDLLHVKRDAVKTLEITGPEGSYALARDDKGEWSFTRPLATRAGRWSVDGLLGTIESLRMESVASEDAKDLKTYGLDKPARTVTLGLADGTSKKLEIGSSPSEKKHHARDANKQMVVVIPGALVDDLAKGMKELRAKRLMEVATYEVSGFDVEADGTRRVLEKTTTKDKDGVETSKWKRTAPDAKDLDTNKVQDVLFQIGGMEAQDFIDAPAAPETYGLDKAAVKVTLRYGEGKPPAWFEVGTKDGAYYGRRVGDTSILKLDPAKAAELVKAFKEI
jgi:Domain of unknown function (DUF4340)